ncbi:MAG: hypothetical protein OEY33_05055, partial [Bdellovibrionales bacterium]|nr:hypothetical protein [Bdellovibrionales bacterium]
RYAILVCIFFINISAFGEPSVKITVENNNQKALKLGQIFEGVITVHPIEQSYYNSLLRLEGQFILDSLFISKIKEIKKSENNPDVLEAYWQGVMIKPFEPKNDKLKLKLGDIDIPITHINIKTEGQPVEIKGYTLIDQERVLKDFELRPWMMVTVIILLVVFFYTFKMWKKYKYKKDLLRKEKEEIETWVRVFSRASELEDFEKIYDQRDQWKNILKYDENKFLSFRTQINQVQFKKNKNKHDIQLVSESYNTFKKDIEIKNGV